jgi:hypothetical protein
VPTYDFIMMFVFVLHLNMFTMDEVIKVLVPLLSTFTYNILCTHEVDPNQHHLLDQSHLLCNSNRAIASSLRVGHRNLGEIHRTLCIIDPLPGLHVKN